MIVNKDSDKKQLEAKRKELEERLLLITTKADNFWKKVTHP
ncbi:MAG: hypothetical protein AABY39_11520 [Nitrospirota bacterium]